VPGEVLDGKYQITGELGRGAMGIVYEGIHLALERRVAVKTLLEEVSADPQIGARFEREARAASAIGHPNIIDVFDLGRTHDGLLYMVMELLDGESLGAMLKRTSKLPIPLTIHLMRQVLGGLAAAHKHGIVHRDLKPDNIFVMSSEERPNFVKILDFGISKIIAPSPGAGSNLTAKVAGTMVGSVLGTPLYMSPEQAIGQVSRIDHRTDIYSAGVVLYEMLCGRTPHLGDNYVQVFASLLEGAYPAPRSLAPEIPADLEAAIVHALDRDMDKRFPSAAAMRQALGGSAELTPAPALVPVAVGEPLRLPDSGPGVGRSSIVLVEEPVAAHPGSPSGRTGSVGDPFAPPADLDAGPILAADLDLPPALRTPVRAVDPPGVPQPIRRRSPKATGGTMAPEQVVSPRMRSRLVLALALLALAIAGRIAYSALRPDGQGSLSIRAAAVPKVALAITPDEAAVQLDHRPTTERELALEAGTEHLLNVAAPGRLTRRFSFLAKPGQTFRINLGHSLPLPSPMDPPPLPAELSAECPEHARPLAEVETAFAKLDRYAECLALTGDGTADGKKTGGRVRMRPEDYARCQRLVREAAGGAPALPELQAAAETFLAATRGAHLEPSTKLGTTFRAELLAVRTAWQMEELALARNDGPVATWHMRRLALAAWTWLRTLKAGSGVEQAADKLQKCHIAFLDNARKAGSAEPGSGQQELEQAVAEVVALAKDQSGTKPADAAAFNKCRRLLSLFNALVLP
jgi:serine/threonine protein kinase